MSTIKDVARLAGVSHGTVSNIINSSKPVSPDKIKRVEEAMKQLGYQPSAAARTLKNSTRNVIAVILPNIKDAVYVQFYNYLQQNLRENGYQLCLYTTNEVAEYEIRLLQNAQSEKYSGVILVTCQPDNTEFFEPLLQNEDTRYLFLQRELQLNDYNFVGMDLKDGMYRLVKRIQEKGYRKCALMTGPSEYQMENRIAEGFCRAMGDDGENYIVQTNYDKSSSFLAAFRLMQMEEPPEVIISTSSLLAEGVREAVSITDPQHRQIHLEIALSGNPWELPKQSEICYVSYDASAVAAQAVEVLSGMMKEGIFHNPAYRMLDCKMDFSALDRRLMWGPERMHQKEKSVSPKERKIKVLLLDCPAAYATYSLLPLFHDQYNAEVELEILKYDEIYDRIIKESAESNFDLFCMDIPWIPELSNQGLITDITDQMREVEGIFSSTLLKDFSQFQDRYYGLPYYYCAQMLFYRKDLFGDLRFRSMFYKRYKTELKPPKTWPEFNAVAEFFTKSCNPDSPVEYGTTLGSRNSSGAVCEYLPRLWAFGGEIWGKKNKLHLDTNQAIKALENYCSCFDYAPAESVDYWWDEQVKQFSDGNAAMMMTFGSHAMPVMDRSKSKVVGKVGYDIIPGGYPILGGWSLAINEKSRNKDLAWEFLKWTCQPALSLYFSILGGCVPTRDMGKAYELQSLYPWYYEHLKMYKQCRSRMEPIIKDDCVLSEYEFEKILGKAVHSATTGQSKPDEALKSAQEELYRLYNNI